MRAAFVTPPLVPPKLPLCTHLKEGKSNEWSIIQKNACTTTNTGKWISIPRNLLPGNLLLLLLVMLKWTFSAMVSLVELIRTTPSIGYDILPNLILDRACREFQWKHCFKFHQSTSFCRLTWPNSISMSSRNNIKLDSLRIEVTCLKLMNPWIQL